MVDAPKTLLLGLGNATRGDDGAGWEVVCLFDFLRIPGLETRVAPQLGPELLEEWGGFDRVVFVDASIGEAEVRLERVVESEATPASSTHHLKPETLLQLSRALNTRCPELYVCSVPASNFEFGEPFSATTRRNIHQAVRLLIQWLTDGKGYVNTVEAQLQQP